MGPLTPRSFGSNWPVASLLAMLLGAGALAALPYIWWRYGWAALPAAVAALCVVLTIRALPAIANWSEGRIALVALLVGAAARIAAYRMIGQLAPQADPLSYAMLAQSLLYGHGLSAWGVRAHYPPLYPLLLAGTSIVTGWAPKSAAPLLNVITDLLGAAAIAWLARGEGKRAGAALAAGLYFLWPSFVMTSVTTQKESLTILLALVAMIAVMRMLARARPVPCGLVLGASWALLALTQPALVSFPPLLFGLAVVVRRVDRGAVTAAGCSALVAFLLIMTPWWIRNWAVFGHFVPFTTVGGLAFWGLFDPTLLAHVSPVDPGEYVIAQSSMHQALRAIAFHPAYYLAHVVLNAGRALLFDVAGVQQYYFYVPRPNQFAFVAVLSACQLSWALLWFCVARSLRLGARSPRTDAHLLLAAAVALQLAWFNIWLQFGERHRYLLTPVLILFAVRALQHERRAGDRGHAVTDETGAGARNNVLPANVGGGRVDR